MQRIGYIYRTTNLVNGKIYIGQHQRDELDRRYYGSGVMLQKALKKYGKANFQVDVIVWEDTVEKLNEAEIKFIAAFNSTIPSIGYNLSTGGESGNKGSKQSEETKRLIGLGPRWNKGIPMSDEHKKRQSERQKGKPFSDRAIQRAREANTGKHLSEEHKKKVSASSMGKKGTRNGAVLTEETKKKISESNKGKHSVPMSEATKSKLSKHWKGKPWSPARRAAYERSRLELIDESKESANA